MTRRQRRAASSDAVVAEQQVGIAVGFDEWAMIEARFAALAQERGMRYFTSARYLTDKDMQFNLAASDESVLLYRFYRGEHGYSDNIMFEKDDTLIRMSRATDAVLDINVAGSTFEATRDVLARLKEQFPKVDLRTPDTVPFTFWSLSPRGPDHKTRPITAPEWSSMAENYTGDTRDVLDQLVRMRPDNMASGKLILWHGPPGAGKSYALRSLAREWREWAEFHYIMDPENFFGASAAYMNEVVTHADSNSKWRVLVLEDTGELLTKDAKARMGQALSRLLNLTDGLIGQGLRVLVLITSNEDVSSFHEAVIRPGRTIANIKYGFLTPEETIDWMKKRNPSIEITGKESLAEMYSMLSDAKQIRNRPKQKQVGFQSA